MSEVGSPECPPAWLTLREGADAAARSAELVDRLSAHLRIGLLTVRDLGCGTGAMVRWLAPRLPGPQHWTLHDREPELLARAEDRVPCTSGDGTPVMTRICAGDVTRLSAVHLAGTRLVTASALLDLLTADEVEALAEACVDAGCAALFTLNVSGRVRLVPAHPLDAEIAAAFNAHQQRVVAERRLLGPTASCTATRAFVDHDATVTTRASTWRLGPDRATLLEEWLRGWIAAACEQRPALVLHAPSYLRWRLASLSAGLLRAEVGHLDVLALPHGK